jgi:hypothetical protein
MRGLGLLFVVYLVNAVFNLGELVERNGAGALSRPSNLAHALLLDDVSALVAQAPAVVVGSVGVIAFFVFQLYRARRRYRRALSEAERLASRSRAERLEVVYNWLLVDPEQEKLVGYLIDQARFRTNLAIAILVPAASVLGARLLVLWHQR